jgi:hypothetical protein
MTVLDQHIHLADGGRGRMPKEVWAVAFTGRTETGRRTVVVNTFVRKAEARRHFEKCVKWKFEGVRLLAAPLEWEEIESA